MGRILGGAALVAALLPVPVPAVTTMVESAFDGSEPDMPMRLFRDGSGSTCEAAPFPGDINIPSTWRSFRFCASKSEPCYTVTYDAETCEKDVHLMAYRSSFDPDDLMANYIGDIGASEELPFSFVVPAGGAFLIVAQTNFGMATCRFSFTVDAGPCTVGTPMVSEVGVVVVGGALLLLGVTALRRPRQALAAVLLAVAIAIPAGPAVAPLSAGTPRGLNSCELNCVTAMRACAIDQCDSHSFDRNPACLEDCGEVYSDCIEVCD
jgi:hypothetical protein